MNYQQVLARLATNGFVQNSATAIGMGFLLILCLAGLRGGTWK